jgi:hypothetical protein
MTDSPNKMLSDSSEPTPAREQHGFPRTRCGCELCRAPCRHMPGSLDVADLERLCPVGEDAFAWAEQHLRAIIDKGYPTLVPCRQPNGSCHWLFDGMCAVHENAPYGCAFFDTHMPPDEVCRRSEATVQARKEDATKKGLYYRVWQHLCRKGLTTRSGDRSALAAEGKLIRRDAQRARRRLEPG